MKIKRSLLGILIIFDIFLLIICLRSQANPLLVFAADYISNGSFTGGTAETGCYWDITGIDVSQSIPSEQEVDDYSIDLVLTIAAT